MNDNETPGTSKDRLPLNTATIIKINKFRQEGNPLIKFIRNIAYEYTAIKPDYECGGSCGILFLALKYHKQHQNYIGTRFADCNGYEMKILLVLVNVDEPTALLRDLNMHCLKTGWILILCYSYEEAAEYLENFKISEKKKPEEILQSREQFKQKIQQQQQQNLGKFNKKTKEDEMKENIVKFLTSIRSVTISDAKSLIGSFGTLKNISQASKMDLTACPGLGPVKADNVFNFFRTPMRK